MFHKQKGWFYGGPGKPPKNLHSLENLKYIYGILSKNQTVTEHNKKLLVESLRSMAEILIWGDQNDTTVFDYFLEKNMLSFFMKFMSQPYNTYICVQLLQTLNILFENIRHETSLYFLLSNNHINAIIKHKFNFVDEEVMAYYISFLKSLSLKLNKHTVHFFYNEHTDDFALYSEAIKFFNHSENMVRIAVRTITLNVYKVDDLTMQRFIHTKTAVPYFSNLVWFIGNHVLQMDTCLRHDKDHNSKDRLSDLVAEHLNHLYYLNDMLNLNITALNEILTEQLLECLFLPLYVHSLVSTDPYTPSRGERPRLSLAMALFLLAQVFLTIIDRHLVDTLMDFIFNCESLIFEDNAQLPIQHTMTNRIIRGFHEPVDLLTDCPVLLDQLKHSSSSSSSDNSGTPSSSSLEVSKDDTRTLRQRASSSSFYCIDTEDPDNNDTGSPTASTSSMYYDASMNSTDEQKLQRGRGETDFNITKKPYINVIYQSLNCKDSDYLTLFSLSVLHALSSNEGVSQERLCCFNITTRLSKRKNNYNVLIVAQVVEIINEACQNDSKIRLSTLELAIGLLLDMTFVSICRDDLCDLSDAHLAAIEGAKETATLVLRTFYKVWEKSEEIFLDMFEKEIIDIKNQKIDVERLLQDSCLLLSVTGTPLTGIEFTKRWPCGEVEKARRAISVFLQLRQLSFKLRKEKELFLPLTRDEEIVKPGDVLNLNNRDLLACTLLKESKKERYFLVIDTLQLILVEPEMKKLGWGVVTFVGFLQDVELTSDKDDSRSLHITVHRTQTPPSFSSRHHGLKHSAPLLSGHFVFDDHIRCMAAKQRLTKGRLQARQKKMTMIALLLELPPPVVDAIYQCRSTQDVRSLTNKRSTTPQGQILRTSRVNKMAGGAIRTSALQKTSTSSNHSGGSTGPTSNNNNNNNNNNTNNNSQPSSANKVRMRKKASVQLKRARSLSPERLHQATAATSTGQGRSRSCPSRRPARNSARIVPSNKKPTPRSKYIRNASLLSDAGTTRSSGSAAAGAAGAVLVTPKSLVFVTEEVGETRHQIKHV